MTKRTGDMAPIEGAQPSLEAHGALRGDRGKPWTLRPFEAANAEILEQMARELHREHGLSAPAIARILHVGEALVKEALGRRAEY